MTEQTTHDRMKAERKYYLGYLKDSDKIPGSDVTVGKARKDFEKIRDAQLAKETDEREAFNATEAASRDHTSVVTAGVVSDLLQGDASAPAKPAPTSESVPVAPTQ